MYLSTGDTKIYFYRLRNMSLNTNCAWAWKGELEEVLGLVLCCVWTSHQICVITPSCVINASLASPLMPERSGSWWISSTIINDLTDSTSLSIPLMCASGMNYTLDHKERAAILYRHTSFALQSKKNGEKTKKSHYIQKIWLHLWPRTTKPVIRVIFQNWDLYIMNK